MEGVTTMAELLTPVTTVSEKVFELVGTVASTIVDTPILMVSFSLFVVGAGIGFFKRLLSAS